jgi:hypothetical protein
MDESSTSFITNSQAQDPSASAFAYGLIWIIGVLILLIGQAVTAIVVKICNANRQLPAEAALERDKNRHWIVDDRAAAGYEGAFRGN